MFRAFLMACAVALVLVPSADAKPKKLQAVVHEAGDFDYYVLSLSWSPAYCATHPKDEQQCGAQRYGLVLHGLWPQYARGGFPETCATEATLDEDARTYANGIFPSEKLVVHEWNKHGTCSGLDAMSYFTESERARNSISVPERLEPGTRVLNATAQEIMRMIRDSNPGLTSSMLTVHCAGPQLSEVRVCLSRSLDPQECGNGMRSSCRAGKIQVRGVK
jgi:ribonuclease T2